MPGPVLKTYSGVRPERRTPAGKLSPGLRTTALHLAFLWLFAAAFAFPVRAADRALVVGVDVYKNQGIAPTPGAVADARAMRQLLIDKLGFSPQSVRMLLDDQASAAAIVQNFQSWIVDGTRPGDRVFFFYAGHGFQAPDDNGDEADKLDEIITPHDVAISAAGNKIVLSDDRTFIRDDKFNDFIAALAGRRTVFVFDSCHSGTLSRSISDKKVNSASRYLKLAPSRAITDDTYSYVPSTGQQRDIGTIKETALDGSVNGVVLFSAASPYQEAFPIELKGSPRGAFSYLFESILRQDESVSLDELEQRLKSEMKRLADQGLIGRSRNHEFQVPQMEIVSRSRLNDKSLFSGAADDYTAAVPAALFNPISTMTVGLEMSKSRYRLGEVINYSVDLGAPGNLYILVFSTENKAFCIFPSGKVGDTLNDLPKGRHAFPREGYITKALEPVGKDVWVALVTNREITIGEKEEYTWDEIFERIGVASLRKAVADRLARSRSSNRNLERERPAVDWQAAVAVVEVVR